MTYVRLSSLTFERQSRLPLFVEAAGRAKQQRFVDHRLFPGRHDPMIARPEALALFLLEPFPR